MVSAALRLLGADLQRQWLRLKAEVEMFKNRATGEVKRAAVDTVLAVSLALAGIFFLVLTLVTGLIALYRWVGIEYGAFAGLGAVAALTALLAIVLLVMAAGRAKSAKPSMPPMPDIKSIVATMPATTVTSPAALMEAVKHDLAQGTAGAASEAMRTASNAVRTGSRETVLATLAAAAVAGIVIGRWSAANR